MISACHDECSMATSQQRGRSYLHLPCRTSNRLSASPLVQLTGGRRAHCQNLNILWRTLLASRIRQVFLDSVIALVNLERSYVEGIQSKTVYVSQVCVRECPMPARGTLETRL